MKQIKTIFLAVLAALSPACGQSASHHAQAGDSLLTIREQGSFLIGDTVKTQPGTYDTRHPLRADGQTLHGDHAYVSYQIPADARRIPLVFLHGAGQSAKTWESTPDGREGFATLFLRRGFSTYLIDQPRRGRAGRSTADETVKATPDDQFWFENFRMGVWSHYYQGSQFPRSAEALEQFFRQMTPNTGAYDERLIATDVAALMDKTGGGILVTHSQGGGPGWHAAIKSANVRAIVSYEPGSGFVFPEGETPQAMQTISPFGALTAHTIPPADFEKLTRIPIVICYGGYIPDKPSDNGGQWTAGGAGSKWRALLPHASTATAATPQSYTCPSWASGATPTPSLQRRTMCSLPTCCPHGLPKGGLTAPAPPRWRICAGFSEKCTYPPGGFFCFYPLRKPFVDFGASFRNLCMGG